MEFILLVLLLVGVGFICMSIYLSLKVFQHVMQATILYKEMIVRLDGMLKVLSDIRDIHLVNPKDLGQDSVIFPRENANQLNHHSERQTEVGDIENTKIRENKEISDLLDGGICPACGMRTSRALKKCSSCMADFSLFDKA